MIHLTDDTLEFLFPEVHPDARLRIHFQRTLRIPDDGKTYPLPPGLGPFPVRLVDDLDTSTAPEWQRRGGVAVPMYQSEAMWIRFGSYGGGFWGYPFAVKVAAGKINAVNGRQWTPGLESIPQGYVVAPDQPWLDGFAVGEGVIRQFVAMPLGAGYSAEEQITGAAEFGGLQIEVFPMKPEAYASLLSRQDAQRSRSVDAPLFSAPLEMGLAPGGRMRQEIYDDRYGAESWSTTSSRCFVHIANTLIWRQLTGMEPPQPPVTAVEYAKHGLPWFDYYNDGLAALEGSEALAGLKSVAEMGEEKGNKPLPENESVTPGPLVALGGARPAVVRETELALDG